MAQFNWTYLSDQGKKYRVGLFHGNSTGHLLIYCNSRIVLIDFGVRESSTYSFFIEEELCEIELERKGNRFFYGFNINNKVDTPLNRRRRKIEKRHWRQSLLFFGAIVLAAVIFSALFLYFRSAREATQAAEVLNKGSTETVARISLRHDQDDSVTVLYSFVAGGKIYESSIKNIDPEELAIGMPLQSGDEFQVSYARKNPRINQLNLDQPSRQQVAKYYRRALNKHIEHNPGIAVPLARCQVDIAFNLKGIRGFADLYFQKEDPATNPHHNKHSYLRLIRDTPFKNKVAEQCWR